MDPRTGEATVYAAGVRNSVGMAWHPQTGELWFSDNGRDWLGDDLPPEEINRVRKPGAHYGYPYIHGDDIADPEFGAGHDPGDHVAPEVAIQAHSAALGLAFYTGEQFTAEWRHALFVAEHGLHGSTPPAMGECRYFLTRQRSGMLPRLKAPGTVRRRWDTGWA